VNYEREDGVLSLQISVLDFLKAFSRTPTLPPALLDAGNDDPNDTPAFQVEVPSPYIVICF
jgi:hypothetical protein